MSVIILGDEETCIGFSLIGVDTIILTPDVDFKEKIREIVKNNSFELVIIGEDAFLENADFIIELKSTYKRPLFVPVPDIFGDRLGNYVEETLKKWVGVF